MLKQYIRTTFQKFKGKIYLKSSIWLLSEKVFRLFITFFTSILIARYLGPSLLGALNYSIALISILYPLVDFGLNSIVVKEFFNKHVSEDVTLTGAVFIKIVIGMITLLVLNGYIFFTIPMDQQIELLITITSISLLFRMSNVFDYWFEAKVKGKYPAKNKAVTVLIISIMKVVAILLKSSVYIFASIFVIEYMIQLIGILYLYNRVNKGWKIIFELSVIKNLIKKSWLLIFSGIATIVYLKIDLIMLGMMLNTEEVGIYSVAARLSETFYFIPITVSSVIFPKIIKYKEISDNQYYKEILRLLKMFFFISLTISVFINIFSSFIIYLLFGSEFIDSAKILSIHIWASIFVFSGSILSKWLVIEDKLSYSLIRQITGAILNVLLNYFLIPMYGGVGAAIATLISYSIANYWITLFNKKTIIMFKMITKSYFSPFFIIYKIVFRKSK